MKCEHTVVTTFYLLVAILKKSKGDSLNTPDIRGRIPRKDTGGECYRAEFSEDVWPCPDFENKVMKCEPLELGLVEGTDGQLGLQGTITIDATIEEDTIMNMDVWKILDVGNEYLYHAEGDMCSSLKDSNTPWFPMVDSMKITECPIAVKNYDIKDMVVDLSYAKDIMNHEMCGDYLIQMSMTKELDKLSCYELGVSVSEYSCNKDE